MLLGPFHLPPIFDDEFLLGLGGIVSAIVNHTSLVVTMNVHDHTTSFAGGLPDRWMYPEKDLDVF